MTPLRADISLIGLIIAFAFVPAHATPFDQCGYVECQTCTATGYLTLRADDGQTYQLSGITQVARGLHRVRVTGGLNENCSVTCAPADGCIGNPVVTTCHAKQIHFTSDADFRRGNFINLNTAVSGQLSINTWAQTKQADPPVLPYLWVACSARSTVVRIAIDDFYSPADGRCVSAGEILGEYRTAPDGCGGSFGGFAADPSRTTVDFDGNVWVANRADIQAPNNERHGHVVKIGTGLAYQWIDRDGDGLLDTSTGLGDILDWDNEFDQCTSLEVWQAKDELILLYQPIVGNGAAMGTRTLAVDRRGDIWVGGNVNGWHVLLDGQSGAEKTSIGQQTCGGYGGVVDCHGVLWSARGVNVDCLLRYDPAVPWAYALGISQSYGLAVDPNGYIWNSQYGANRITKINPIPINMNPVTFQVDTSDYTGPDSTNHKGVAVTPDDNNVWVASEGTGNITRFANNTLIRKYIPLTYGMFQGLDPTGIAVDSREKLWVTNYRSHDVMRIDPTGGVDGLGAVDRRVFLGDGAFPYNYSDMTGIGLVHNIAPAGVWTAVIDGGFTERPWRTFCWTEEPGAGEVIVRARAAENDYRLGREKYVTLTNGEVRDEPLYGRYLQIRVQLNAYCHNPSQPVLKDFTICRNDTIASAVPPNGTIDARQPHPHNDNSMEKRQGIGSPNSYPGYANSPEPITITLRHFVDNPNYPVLPGADRCCWGLCETGQEEIDGGGTTQPNDILSVTQPDPVNEPGQYRILLERPISAGHWTQIIYRGDESSVWYASLPGDANLSRESTDADINYLINCLNQVYDCSLYQTDMNHSGAGTAADIARIIDLLNGAAEFVPWLNKTIPAYHPSCGKSLEFLSESSSAETAEVSDGVEAELAAHIVYFLTAADPSDPMELVEFEATADALTGWVVQHFTGGQQAALVEALSDPEISFASEAGAAKAAEIVERLNQ